MNDRLAIVISKLSDKLGVKATYLWGVLLKQAHIEAIKYGIGTAILFILFLFCTIMSCVCLSGITKSKKPYNVDCDIIPLFLCSFIFFMLFLFTGDEFINLYFNPQYWALDQVIASVR